MQTAGLKRLSLFFVDVYDFQTAEGVSETALHRGVRYISPSQAASEMMIHEALKSVFRGLPTNSVSLGAMKSRVCQTKSA